MIGSTSHSGDGKDLELFVLLPQPCVELPGTVETRVVVVVEVPQSDFAVQCVEVNEAAGISLRSENNNTLALGIQRSTRNTDRRGSEDLRSWASQVRQYAPFCWSPGASPTGKTLRLL